MGFFSRLKLDYPVSIGDYRFPSSPNEPMVLHLVYVPTTPRQGLEAREQFRQAREALYSMSFEDFDDRVRDELTRMLGPGGFDADRDILAITVNRWGHGYSYMADPLFDPVDGGPPPFEVARRRVGNVAIANADAAWNAFTHVAIEQAHRAVGELLDAT
jgi:spermidine dehydrogenase